MELLFESAGAGRQADVHVLPFEGVENFRDLGGCQTRDGRRVRHGLLYRSSALFRMTPADRRLFETLHIGYILDYRNAAEVAHEPNPSFSATVQERISAVAQDEFSCDVYLTQSYRESLRPNGLADYYRALAENAAAYSRLLAACLDTRNRAILQHCAAGKDRTGVGAAILYMALGVPRDAIMEDYLLSNLLLRRYIHRQLAQVAAHYTGEELRYFTDTLLAKEEYLQTFFDSVDARFPAEQAFLEAQFGMTPARIQRLRNKYLEG